jgi:subtilisin-like proprotein convertase family protein
MLRRMLVGLAIMALTLAAAAPATAAVYSATDVPVTIGNTRFVTLTADTPITDNGAANNFDLNMASAIPSIAVVRVNNIDIVHPHADDLDVKLKSPAGTTINLFNDICVGGNWGSGDVNFDLANDEPLPMIGSSCPPGTGAYAPQPGNLNSFIGESGGGKWTLTITDDTAGNAGTLRNVQLEIVPLTSSTISVPSGPNIRNLGIRDIRIAHTNPQDLDVTLRSPAGTTVELFTDVCGATDWTSDNTGFALFADAAGGIGETCPPGTATFRPEGNLGAFNGQASSGVWTLEILDDLFIFSGTLQGWSLDVADPPDTSITSAPSQTTDGNAQFAFESNVAGSAFECSLDGAAFTSCTSPALFTGLAIGPHNFSVRAIDPVGNVDASPATASLQSVLPDSDGDGFADPFDRCPSVARGDFDRDNDGCPGPFPRLRGDATLKAVLVPGGIRVLSLSVSAPKGSRAALRCVKKCKLKEAHTARTLRFKKIRGKRLKRGTVFDVRITKANSIGLVIRYTVGRRGFSKKSLCIPVGGSKPQRRCAAG